MQFSHFKPFSWPRLGIKQAANEMNPMEDVIDVESRTLNRKRLNCYPSHTCVGGPGKSGPVGGPIGGSVGGPTLGGNGPPGVAPLELPPP